MFVIPTPDEVAIVNLNWSKPTPPFEFAVTLKRISLPSAIPVPDNVSSAKVGNDLKRRMPDTAVEPVALIVVPEFTPVPCVPVESVVALLSIAINEPCVPSYPVPICLRSTLTVRSLSASLGRTTTVESVEVAFALPPVKVAVPTIVPPSQIETCARSEGELDAVTEVDVPVVSVRPIRLKFTASFVARKRRTPIVLPVVPPAAIAYEGLEGEIETTSEPAATTVCVAPVVTAPVATTVEPEVTPVTVSAAI